MVRPQAGWLPEVRHLFELGLQHGALNPQVAINQICASAADPRHGIFIGLDPTPLSLMVVILPFDPRTSYPQIEIGVNIGSRTLFASVIQTGLVFMRQAGYNKTCLFNFSGHSDAAYIRTFRHYGIEMKPRATLMEFTF